MSSKNVDSADVMKSATNSYFPKVLSSPITLGFFGILGWMMMHDHSTRAQTLLFMLGSLGTAFGAVVNLWPGSNKGWDRTKELRGQVVPIRTWWPASPVRR